MLPDLDSGLHEISGDGSCVADTNTGSSESSNLRRDT